MTLQRFPRVEAIMRVKPSALSWRDNPGLVRVTAMGPKPFTPTLHPKPSRSIPSPNLQHAELYLAHLKPSPPHPKTQAQNPQLDRDADPIPRPEIYRLQLLSLKPKPELKAEDFVLSFELRKGGGRMSQAPSWGSLPPGMARLARVRVRVSAVLGGVSSPPPGRLALLAPDGAPRSRVALRRSEPSERPQHGHPTGTQGLGRG